MNPRNPKQPDWFFLIEDSIRSNKKEVPSIWNFPRRNATTKQIYICLTAKTNSQIHNQRVDLSFLYVNSETTHKINPMYLPPELVKTTLGNFSSPSANLTPVVAISVLALARAIADDLFGACQYLCGCVLWVLQVADELPNWMREINPPVDSAGVWSSQGREWNEHRNHRHLLRVGWFVRLCGSAPYIFCDC